MPCLKFSVRCPKCGVLDAVLEFIVVPPPDEWAKLRQFVLDMHTEANHRQQRARWRGRPPSSRSGRPGRRFPQ